MQRTIIKIPRHLNSQVSLYIEQHYYVLGRDYDFEFVNSTVEYSFSSAQNLEKFLRYWRHIIIE